MKRRLILQCLSFLCFLLICAQFAIASYLDGERWVVGSVHKFQTMQASGYSPNANYESALDIARKKWELALEGCIKFTKKKQSGKCSGTYSEPLFCVEKGGFDMGDTSAGLGKAVGGKFKTFKTKSQNVEAGYGYAAMLIGRALGLRSQFEVRADFSKHIVINYEALIQSMTSLSESYGAFHVLPKKWKVKHISKLVKSIYKRHCKKTIYKFDYPFDFRSIANSFNPFGDVAYQFSILEPSAAYVARDRSNHWMIGYSQLTRPSLMISHYDRYRIMKEYKCEKVFKCKNVPKCRNHAYLNSACQCTCAPGFTGWLCEKWIGNATYPRAQKAKCHYIVSEPQVVSLVKAEFYTENEHWLSHFALGSSLGFYSQWCTIEILAFGDHRPIIEPIANLIYKKVSAANVIRQSSFVLDWFDCNGMVTGQIIYNNPTKRRVLCFSSLYLEDSPNIRVNRSDTNIDLNWLWTYFAKAMTPHVMRMQFGITYEKMPSKVLRLFLSRQWAFEHGIDEDAMRSVGGLGAGAIAGIIISILILLAVLGGLYYIHRQRKKERELKQSK